jgi:hypothetical protein
MSDARLIYELEELLAQNAEESATRHAPLLAKDVKDKNLVQLLADKVMAWPTTDLRLEHKYLIDNNVQGTDSAFMKDVAAGMALRLRSKDMKQGMITVDVLFQNNMAEFERYNLAVQQHNDAWAEAGAMTEVFDPKTGDILPVADNYVAPVYPQENLPQTFTEDTSSGKLASARPTIKRAVGITLQYKVSLRGDTFKLEYVAKDTKGRVLYFAVGESSDLTTLVRRSVQGLWGNHTVYGDEGNLLDGIAQLYQGRKAKSCTLKPSFLESDYRLKNVSLEVAASKVTQGTINGVGIPLLGYVIPLMLAWLALGGFVNVIAAVEYSNRWVWYPIFPVPINAESKFMSFVVAETIILSLMYISTRISAYLARKAAALEMREKFI